MQTARLLHTKTRLLHTKTRLLHTKTRLLHTKTRLLHTTHNYNLLINLKKRFFFSPNTL